jgi:beta-glucosidase
VSVNLANTGARAGAEVVQVYLAAPAEAGEPPRQLKAFIKVSLRPNQVQRLTVKLDGRAFSIWDKSKNRWSIAPGRYGLFVGLSSRDLQLQGSVLVRPNIGRVAED